MENGIKKIAVFGDSILKGAVTGINSGHLFDVVEENSLVIAQKKFNFELQNYSVFGNTIIKGQRKLNAILGRSEKFDLGIIEFGGNDCDYDWGKIIENPNEQHSQKVPLKDFLSILKEMVLTLRNNQITPLIMTMPPLVNDFWFNHLCKNYEKEKILTFVKNNENKFYQNHEIYNLSLIEFAVKNKIQFVDMRREFLLQSDNRDFMCLDGIHPNQKGYELMGKIWINQLPKIKKEF